MAQRTSGYERKPKDFYSTPPWVTEAIVEHLRLSRTEPVWEPAAGTGAIVKVLQAAGYRVVSTDITNGFDFLRDQPTWPIRNILTNPPYGCAEQFIERALKLTAPARGLVAMLLRVDFESAVTRSHLFDSCAMFSEKLVLKKRIKWFEGPGTKSPSENHAWYGWRHNHDGAPSISFSPIRHSPGAFFTASKMEVTMATTKPELSTIEGGEQEPSTPAIEQEPIEPVTEQMLDADEAEFAKLRRDLPGVKGASVAGIVTVTVTRNPVKNEFFRTHPDFHPEVLLVQHEEGMEKEFYAVDTDMEVPLKGIGIDCIKHRLYMIVTPRGGVRIIPISCETDNEWVRTKEIGLLEGEKRWVRIYSDKENTSYKVYPAPDGRYADPIWPELKPSKIFRLAFRDKGRLIDSPEHPLFKKWAARDRD